MKSEYRLDGEIPKILRTEVTVNQSTGKVRVNGMTDFERKRDFIKKYGEDKYVSILFEENIKNPKGIKIKNPELAEKIIKAGLQD